MFFRQFDDGSCDLNFTEEEIKILNNHKKLHFTPKSLKHFGDCLVKMVWEFNTRLGPEVKNLMTNDTSIAEGVEPKKDD